jgi:hypothetical protein
MIITTGEYDKLLMSMRLRQGVAEAANLATLGRPGILRLFLAFLYKT